LKKNKEFCSKCGQERLVWKRIKGQPYCQFCSSPMKALKKTTPKIQAKNKERRVKLNIYFDYHIEQCLRSEESGQVIPYPSKVNICHIFPKRVYHSVENNLDNFVYLTAEEHNQFDHLLDLYKFEELEKNFKNSWSKICTRAKKLLPLIIENKKLKIEFELYLKTKI